MTEKVSWDTDPATKTVTTKDLHDEGLYDFQVVVQSASLLSEAEAFVQHMIKYQRHGRRRILPNETVTYGFWTTKFVVSPKGLLEVWEYDPETETEWVPGIERTLRYWQGQRQLCSTLGATFEPPHGSYFALASDGVVKGALPIEGVRYPADAPDSGWIFTADDYTGDLNSLKKVHLYHITTVRPELMRLVGLPPGYFFKITTEAQTSGVWFDPDVANTPKL